MSKPIVRSPSVLLIVPASDLYGSSRTALAVVSGLLREGCIVTVWVPAEGPLIARLHEAGATVRIVALPVLRRGDWSRGSFLRAAHGFIRTAAGLRTICASEPRADVIHAFCLTNLAGLIVKFSWHRPLLWSVHEYLQSRRSRLVFSALVLAADATVSCSYAVRARLMTPKLRRGVVIHSGADVLAANRGAPPFCSVPPRIICVGRLNAWKGQDVLVEALGHLARAGVRFEASIVGSPIPADRPIEHGLRRRIESLGLEDVVTLLGQRDDVVDLVTAADIAVIPSKRPEPFGKTVVEAMASGRAVIATSGGGPSEIIRDGVDGLLVPPDDPLALAEAMRRILASEPLARTLGAAGIRRAQAFDESSAANAYVALIRKLAA
jgi:glycosyltransferase involved in cell wall biosynthesis